MANYQYANPQMIMQSQYQQIQSMFPQPQGSVYSINSPLEIGNVPIGSTGLSVIQVRPTCCAVMNATNISVVNTGIASTVTNANIVITKIA